MICRIISCKQDNTVPELENNIVMQIIMWKYAYWRIRILNLYIVLAIVLSFVMSMLSYWQ